GQRPPAAQNSAGALLRRPSIEGRAHSWFGHWAALGRRTPATIALTILLGLSGSEATAAILFVKTLPTATSTTTGTTIAVTLTSGVAAGDSIILTLAMGPVSGTVSASDSAGNSYVVNVDVTNASKVRTVILSAHNVSALTSGNTITITHPST